ncbi:MAG: HAD-IA family hydrolase [Fuerstiella sp.]
MDRREIRAVIFDCDGTLVDSETLSLSVLIEHVAELGLQISHAEAMQRFAGNELAVVVREIEERLGGSLPDDFLHSFRSRQIAVLQKQLRACEGADDLLTALQLPFCVASNAPISKIEVCLQTTQLDRHFCTSRIFSAYEIEKWKPEPDLFLKAAAEMEIAPEHCAVVEDSLFGIKAGLAAGMQVFAYRAHGHGFDSPEVTDVGHLAELVEVFC